MYLDNNNFVKELPYKLFYDQNNKPQFCKIASKYYLNFNILKNYESDAEIVRVYELLSNDHTYIIKESISAVFMEHKDIVSIYTKLSLDQTFSQVRVNKYFKSFIGSKQLIYLE
jgi:hypothetical protein